MSSTAAPIPFAGSTLGSYRHVCAFFSSPQDEYDTMLPFVRDGLERGERAYHVVPAEDVENHLERLRSGGIEVAAAQRTGRLEIKTPDETYMRGGRFSQAAMLALIQDSLEAGAALGFPLTRFVAHAQAVWANPVLVDEWIEYEARLNDVLPAYDDPVICTYDSRLLSGSLAVDVLRTHPVAVIGGLLSTNPFFVPPQEFLRRFAHRPTLAGDRA
jgi:hypothetical protein